MPRGATQAKFVEERTGVLAGLLYQLRFLIVYVLFDMFSYLFTVSLISTIVLNTLDNYYYYYYALLLLLLLLLLKPCQRKYSQTVCRKDVLYSTVSRPTFHHVQRVCRIPSRYFSIPNIDRTLRAL